MFLKGIEKRQKSGIIHRFKTHRKYLKIRLFIRELDLCLRILKLFKINKL